MPSHLENVVLGPEAFDCGIQKRLVYAGKEPITYEDGTKVLFHYKTIVSDTGAVIDDSKAANEKKPMEIIIGKKFKLEIWERALKTMWLNEVASFHVMKELLFDYPVVAKQLREYYASAAHDATKCTHKKGPNSNEVRHHCCGYNLIEHGVGYEDLNELLKEPKALDFVFELVRVEKPGEFKKESWTLSEEERIRMIPTLKEDGNALFKEKKYAEALTKYGEALEFLENLMLQEKPNDEHWNKLNEQKMPILFNFSLCKFFLKDYYSCIEHTTTIVKHQPRNVKALFRRAKAHLAAWNIEEARADFQKCAEYDACLQKEVDDQLNYLAKLEKKYTLEQADKFKGKLF